MKFELEGLEFTTPCELLKTTNIFDTKKGINNYRTFNYKELFLITTSVNEFKQVCVFKNDTLLHKFVNLDSSYELSYVSCNNNYIVIGFCNDSAGELQIFNISDFKKIHSINENKAFFAKKFLLTDEYIYVCYFNNNNVVLQKIILKNSISEEGIIITQQLSKEVELSCESKDIEINSNDSNIFLSLPHENSGKVLVLDFKLNLIQTIVQNDISKLPQEFNRLETSGFGLSISSNNKFLAIGAPHRYKCEKDSDNNLKCYRGMVAVYIKINNEYKHFCSIFNPNPENKHNDLFGITIFINNNILYIGNPVYNGYKGIIYKFKLLNEFFNENTISENRFIEEKKYTFSEKSVTGVGLNICQNYNNFLCSSVFNYRNSVYIPTILIEQI